MDEESDMLDTSKFSFQGDFNTQVADLLQHVRLTRHEVENLTKLFDDVEKALRFTWPGCQVFPFGSIVTGMGIRTSDVDCYVQVYNANVSGKPAVIEARNRLKRYPAIFQELIAIATAKVPIVKLFHVPTHRHCDINFDSVAGVRNSKLLAYLLHLDPRALNLAIIIKYWSKVHRLTGMNLMPNYAMTLLVIFYLQQEKILPPVHKLQMHVPAEFTDHWNTAFQDTTSYITYNKKSLYHLLGGFFKFYSNNLRFNESVISLYEGTVLARKDFDRNKVPEAYVLYKENLQRNLCTKLRTDTYICIQDPFEHSRNCAVAVYPKLARRLIFLIKFSASAFEEEANTRFLSEILRSPTENVVTFAPSIPRPNIKPHSTQSKDKAHVVQNKFISNKNWKKKKVNKRKTMTSFTLAFEKLNQKLKG